MEFPSYGALSLKKSLPALKVVSRAHGCDLYPARNALCYLPLRSYFAQQLDAACFISQQGLDFFQHNTPGAGPEKCRLARLGVRAGKHLAQASSDGVFRILSCSFVDPVKRLELLVKALAQLDTFEIVWSHIGDGSQLPRLRTLAQSLFEKRPNIRWDFRGYLTNAQVYEFYETQPVDLFVNLSSSEGLPVSMMEACAFGVPILATEVGGVAEIVSSRNGQLLPAQLSEQQAAQAIGRLGALSTDERSLLRAGAYQIWQERFNAQLNYSTFVGQLLKLVS